MRIVEYPTFRFSRIAAGIINTRAIQLQFLPKKLLNAVFNKRMRTIDKRPQGNSKKVEGFFGMVAMIKRFGALFFFVLIFIAALGVANALSITFYEKSLITVIKDFIFILTRK